MPDRLPSAAALYARKVDNLAEALSRPEEQQEAAEALRMLIEKIELVPGPKRGEIDAKLYGDLGTILNWIEHQPVDGSGKTNTPGGRRAGVLVSLVAGARSYRYRHRIEVAI